MLQKDQDPHLRCDTVLSTVQCVLKPVTSAKSGIFQIKNLEFQLKYPFPPKYEGQDLKLLRERVKEMGRQHTV